jgi:hypothetical protein
MVIGVNGPDLEGEVSLGIMITFLLLPVPGVVRATNCGGGVIGERCVWTMGDDKGEVLSVAMPAKVMTGTDNSRLKLDVRGGSFLNCSLRFQPSSPESVFSRPLEDTLGARVLLLGVMVVERDLFVLLLGVGVQGKNACGGGGGGGGGADVRSPRLEILHSDCMSSSRDLPEPDPLLAKLRHESFRLGALAGESTSGIIM